MDNPEARETLNTRHITKTKKTKNTTQNTENMSNMNPAEKTGGWTLVLVKGKQFKPSKSLVSDRGKNKNIL